MRRVPAADAGTVMTCEFGASSLAPLLVTANQKKRDGVPPAGGLHVT